MGVIIDKTNTRWGKARPWVLWSAPPLVISLIMIFTVPDISANGKAIYLLLVYIFLAVGHYDGTAAVQSASAIFAIKSLFLYLPFVITIVVLIIWYLFMGIDKIYPTVRRELDERRKNAEMQE